MNYKLKIYLIALIVVSISFVFSLVAWIVNFPGKRCVFTFYSLDKNALIAETRFLPVKPVQGDVALFVDELLLGPLTERCRPIFAPGTRAISAFAQDGVLYVNISRNALSEKGGAVSVKEGCEIFSKNILRNFRKVKSVKLFIDSQAVYED